MKSMVKERLTAYNRVQNRLPTAMLFYRDGVGENMFATCEDFESEQIHKAYTELADTGNPPLKLTFVVVGKRHHTRFYPKDGEGHVTSNGNVSPGLLVDQVITPNMNEHQFNSFLQSHHAVQGTARSAHYHVLEDGMKFGKDNEYLANLTHYLCYSFARATKGVSYAAPAYIADRLCDQGRKYLRAWDPSDEFRAPPNPRVGEAQVDMKRWRKKMAKQLEQQELLSTNNSQRVWGHYEDYNDVPSSTQTPRYNPWHPNLDDSMFWM
jgi:eukaryotic translation initiation factor 2C